MKISPTPKPKRSRRPYQYHGPEVWALARAAYLAGESAPSISQRLGMGVDAIRQRITREGWTKRSVMTARDAEILAAAEAEAEMRAAREAEASAPMEPQAAARAALDEAVRLMRSGRTSEALAAARAAEAVARAAERLGGDVRSLPPAEEDLDDETAFELVRRKVLGDLLPLPVGEGGARAGGVGG